MNPIATRLLSASGAWLVDRGKKLAQHLFKDNRTRSRRLADSAAGKTPGGARYTSKREVLDGYVVEAKRAGNVGSVTIFDLPAYLCVLGRYFVDGQFDPAKAYNQTLSLGRDSYLPKTLDAVQDPQNDPLVRSGLYKSVTLGSVSQAGGRLASRLWGVAQPFSSAGCMHGFGVVYMPNANHRYALSWASPTDSFAYLMVCHAPSVVSYVRDKGVDTVVPEDPQAIQASWSVLVSEATTGRISFVRKPDPPDDEFITGWELAQYPWFTFSAPEPFVTEDGVKGFRLSMCAQVVYDAGGPYFEDPDSPLLWGDSDQFSANPAGARGLWVGRLQVVGDKPTLLASYDTNPLSSSDVDRRPTRYTLSYPDQNPIPVYAGNVFYKATPVVLTTGETVVVSVSYAYKRYDGDPDDFPPDVNPDESWMFCDVLWFSPAGTRSQSVSKTQLRKLRYEAVDDKRAAFYAGGLSVFDSTEDEHRFAIGSATDGTYVVAPIFSSFRPGGTPRLHILVATAQAASVAYSGTPGFAMSIGAGGDETVAMGLVDDPQATPPSANQKYWGWQTGDGQVSYIGNDKYLFYISTNWDVLPLDNFVQYIPRGNLAVAVYDRKNNTVAVAGTISNVLTSSINFVDSSFTFGALTQNMLGDRLGKIEVVRLESTGYVVGQAGGNPATLIATRGWGAPAQSSYDEEADLDTTLGRTWISYDSGATWAVVLNYGSPAGAFHCGNLVAPRTEPVLRV